MAIEHMKILITGPLHDFSGYAHVGRNLALALSHTEADVALRHIKYDDYEYKPTELERKMFTNNIRDCDVVLQLTTPNEIRYVPGKMNIAFMFWETTKIPQYWADQLNLMDMIIVPCRFNAMALTQSGVKKPICICHPTFDISLYEKTYKPFDHPEIKDRVVYYNICQMSAKKGVDVLLKSYFRAFFDVPDEPILILKTYLNMTNRQNEMEFIRGMVDQVKRGLRLPVNKYPPVFIITDVLDDEGIYRLHATGDVYVCSSRGEGWGIPPFEALAFGKTVISHNWGGLGDFITPYNSIMYQAYQSIVFDQSHNDPFLYTGMEDWAEPNDHQLMVAMRSVHEAIKGRGKDVDKQKEHLRKLQQKAIDDTRNFDVKLAGPKLYNGLCRFFDSWKEKGYVEVSPDEENGLHIEEIRNA